MFLKCFCNIAPKLPTAPSLCLAWPMFVCPSVFLSPFPYLCLSVHLSLTFYAPVCLPVSLSLLFSILLSNSPPISPIWLLSSFLSVICLPLYFPLCLSTSHPFLLSHFLSHARSPSCSPSCSSQHCAVILPLEFWTLTPFWTGMLSQEQRLFH